MFNRRSTLLTHVLSVTVMLMERVYLQSSSCWCPVFSSPVCGTNGKTYTNACFAACASMSVAHCGPCYKQCSCNNINRSVCGVNGYTYTNDCYLNCVGTRRAHYGPCKCACICNFNPVCGSNGKTYQNDCMRRCANTTLAYHGPCKGLRYSATDPKMY